MLMKKIHDSHRLECIDQTLLLQIMLVLQKLAFNCLDRLFAGSHPLPARLGRGEDREDHQVPGLQEGHLGLEHRHRRTPGLLLRLCHSKSVDRKLR